MGVKRLEVLFKKYPLQGKKDVQSIPAPTLSLKNEKEWVLLEEAEGRYCAGLCGLFPPCTPLFLIGEKITAEKWKLLKNSNNVFGLKDGKIMVFREEN